MTITVKWWWIVLAWLASLVAVWLFVPSLGTSDADIDIKVKTDTVTVIKRDTIESVKPVFITERIVDTIFIEKVSGNGIKLPITERYYKDEGYELWITGYKPELKQINLFTKTEYSYITKETTREIYPKVWSLYMEGGITGFTGAIIPTVSLNLTSPSRWSFRGGIGYYDKRLVYQAGVGYKLTRK